MVVIHGGHHFFNPNNTLIINYLCSLRYDSSRITLIPAGSQTKANRKISFFCFNRIRLRMNKNPTNHLIFRVFAF